MNEKKCLVCGKKYTPYMEWQSYCSEECKKKAQLIRQAYDRDRVRRKACDRPECFGYSKKFKNCCSVVENVNFGERDCPFYKIGGKGHE